jgi:SAM-dependent methyltransferase
VPVLSLGAMPLANALVEPERAGEPEPAYPLDLVRCRSCTLVQITETLPPETLFRQYAYFSSFSDTMVEHARRLVTRLIAERGLGAGSLAMEVASNDGYLLQHYVAAGVPVVGIEPAENIAAVARDRGVRTETAFFGEGFARELAGRGDQADAIHANNVLAHVADLPGFVAGLRTALKGGGLAVVEVPYVKDLLDRCEFDTIYHEHLCYFSLTALDRLLTRQGLTAVHVERLPIHGGSIRLFAAHEKSAPPYDRAEVDALLQEERGWGVDAAAVYEQFAGRVAAWKIAINVLFDDLKRRGRRIAAYGAAAKGATLLNFAGIDHNTIEFVVDRSTYKQGKLMPGSQLPIRPPSALLDEQPDYALLLTWNFADEVLAQQEEFRRRGGKFIIPIPEPRVV